MILSEEHLRRILGRYCAKGTDQTAYAAFSDPRASSRVYGRASDLRRSGGRFDSPVLANLSACGIYLHSKRGRMAGIQA